MLVDDDAASFIYGPGRRTATLMRSALFSWSPVLIASVSLDAAPSSSAESALSTASVLPVRCFVFPYRYEAGAVALARRKPRARIVVSGTPLASSSDSGLPYASVDFLRDAHRSGALAARLRPLLSRGIGAKGEARIFMQQDGGVDPQVEATAFLEGYAKVDHSGDIPPFSVETTVRSVYSEGRADLFFMDGSSLGGGYRVARTWIDPSLLGERLLGVIDDSPYACLPSLARAAKRPSSANERVLVSSSFRVSQHAPSLLRSWWAFVASSL